MFISLLNLSKLMSLIQNNGIPALYGVINNRSLIWRKVYAAVAASGFICVTAEGGLPACIMETLAVDEGHPVLHGCLVSILLTGKGEGACLVGDGVSACVGGTLRCRKAADDVRFHFVTNQPSHKQAHG